MSFSYSSRHSLPSVVMVNVVPSISLLRLPFSVQQRVTRNMDRLEQLSFSILSKKTISVVKSLKNQLHSGTISIKNPLQLTLMFHGISKLSMYFGYGEGQDGEYKSVEKCPENLKLVYYDWNLPGMIDLDEEDEDDSDVEEEEWVGQEGGLDEWHGMAEDDDVENHGELEAGNEDANLMPQRWNQIFAVRQQPFEEMEQEMEEDGFPELGELAPPILEIAAELDEQEVEEDLRGNGPSTVNAVWSTNLTFRGWILHIMNIYQSTHFTSVDFYNGTLDYDLSSIKTALGGIDMRSIAIRESDNEELFKLVTKNFGSTKSFVLDWSFQPKDPDYLQKVLCSNFDFFGISTELNTYFSSLDRLLTNNASAIIINCSTFTNTTLNKFLKLWVRGAMPRLKRLSVNIDPNSTILDKDAILNGLNCVKRGQVERNFGMFNGEFGMERCTARGGYSIKRSDGVEATIQLREPFGVIGHFDFYVWDR